MPSPPHGGVNENSRFEAKGHYRLVLMGAASVGKTALVHQFLYDHFPAEYAPTVEELYRGEFEVGGGGGGLVLDILDTSGSYEFPAMRRLALDTGDAFVLVYAVDDADSFEEVRRLRHLLAERRRGEPVPVVVVGNKSDLGRRRAVQTELADTVVALDWEARFVEASAKENVNVARIFQEVLAQARIPHDLAQRRRTSLPLYALPKACINHRNNKAKSAVAGKKAKRNSCAVS